MQETSQDVSCSKTGWLGIELTELVELDGAVDTDQRLELLAPGPHSQVTDLAVPHHAGRKAHVQPVCSDVGDQHIS